MGVAVGLLGGVRVTLDGVPVHVGGRRPSLVIASLALADQRGLSAERLIDLVWGDDPPPTARRTLQSYVAGLRRDLGGERAPLSPSGAGYVLSIGRNAVDAFVFADAVTRAKTEVDTDPVAAAAGLSAALATWAVPLDGLRPTSALEAVVAPYEALRLEALELLNDVDLDGDVARAVGRLETLVRDHPTRERFWAQLVQGLAALGRRDAALHAGQRAREVLREQLGVGPSRLLVDAEQDVLNDAAATHHGATSPAASARALLRTDLDGRSSPLRVGRGVASNLATPLTSLVGREADTATVTALLDEHRLVTLLGEGGCGKTRLALNVGTARVDRFVDGVWFVDLAPLPAGEPVAPRIAQVLGVDGDVDDLAAALAQRTVLLILDNCEHVVESSAGVVVQLLRRCPTATVLATSRAPLDVGGEMCFPVPPLALPRRGADLHAAAASPAVELFTRRAALVRAGYGLGESDVGAVVELCIRLGGLPLAIELAAARLRTMSVTELVVRLDDRFGVLVGGPRSAPERHRSLRDTIEWSFRLLDDTERLVLRHLAVFRSGCDLDSATAVCAVHVPTAGATLDVLDQLVRQSLLTPVESGGATRYFLHEAIREHVIGATDPGDLDVVHERHARWFARRAAQLSAGPEPAGEQVWVRHHLDDRDNFAAAARWLSTRDAPAALRLLVDIDPGTDRTSDPACHLELLRVVLASAGAAAAADRAAALALLAWTDSEHGRPGALGDLDQAVELLATVDDPVVQCSVLISVAKCHADLAGGALDADEVAAAVAAGDRAGGTYWPVMARESLSRKAPTAIGEALLADALVIAERMDLDHFAAMLREQLACVVQFRDESAVVLATWRRAVRGPDGPAPVGGENACFYALAEGEHADIAVGLDVAEQLLLQFAGAPFDQAVAAMHSVIAHLRRLAGDLAGAHTALETASRGGPAAWDFLGGLSIITRSALWRGRGEPQRAAGVIGGAAHHIGFHGTSDIPMRVLEELAAVAIDLGRHEHGADLLATARRARLDEDKPLSPAWRTEVDGLVAQVGTRHGTPLGTRRAVALAHSLAGNGRS